MERSESQKLVDLVFEIAQHSVRYRQYFVIDGDYKRDEHMKWVADQLKGCGFPTVPMGSSWGVLTGL